MKKIPCVPAQLKGSLLIFFCDEFVPELQFPIGISWRRSLTVISNKDSTAASNIDHMQIDHENQSTILLVRVKKIRYVQVQKKSYLRIRFLISN